MATRSMPILSCRPVSMASRSLVPTPSVPDTSTGLLVAVERHFDQRAEAADAGEHFLAHGALDERLDAFDELVARVDIDAGIAISHALAIAHAVPVRDGALERGGMISYRRLPLHRAVTPRTRMTCNARIVGLVSLLLPLVAWAQESPAPAVAAEPAQAVAADPEVPALVRVNGVETLADYATVGRLLGAVDAVRRLDVVEADGTAVIFRVLVRGGSGALDRGLEGASQLVRAGVAGWPSCLRVSPLRPPGFRMRHLPNLICLARIALIWPTIRALDGGDYSVALALFAVAAVSDGLDGYLAKRFNWTSELGKILDPLADKLLLVSVFIVGAWNDLVPAWLAAAAIARDVMIGLGALAFRSWFGPLRGRPTIISKINTLMQLSYLLGVMTEAATGLPPREMLAALAVVAFITTVLSGIDYIYAFTRRAWAVPAKAP